jgi:L-alanine-DL-glutamate epimerase-like enolase superfamily enzyme
LAAAGGDGLLEIDANFNPIREFLVGGLPIIKSGIMTLPDMPGLGIYPDPEFIKKHAVT